MTTPPGTDKIWKRDEIESPCVKLCVIHPEERICTGCFRSIEEITGWARKNAGRTPRHHARPPVARATPQETPWRPRRPAGALGRASFEPTTQTPCAAYSAPPALETPQTLA